ncbi:MAG: GNAT family N-acetyltransferase [Bdellovibrionales bacterium]|nr:GNAT family N-acetyltransferase [Bdellovibrionales bacterium]
MKIQLLGAEDIPAFSKHLHQCLLENTDPALSVYAPFLKEEVRSVEVIEKKCRESWNRPLHEKGWERVWAMMDQGQMLGHVDLNSGRMTTELHRTYLGMAILNPNRGKGIGRKLLNHAVEWAKAQPSLAWLDLYVFQHNHAAIHLYREAGFQEVFRRDDAYRMRGEKIADLAMTLRLRS